MFTLLDLVNSYLGYFSTNSKTKNRIYTAVSAIGVWYVLYIAYRFLANGRWLRGAMIAIVFVILAYFVVLNIIYYFTNTVVKWDISPKIEKVLGGPQLEEEKAAVHEVIVPANGLYQRQHVMLGEVTVNATQQDNITQLATALMQLGLMKQDYGHLGEQAQRQIILQHDVIFANHPGTLLPYFDMVEVAGDIKIMGGINKLQARELGTLVMVGMTPTHQAMMTYRLALSSVVITGGMGHVATRTALLAVQQPYKIQVEVAYEKKN